MVIGGVTGGMEVGDLPSDKVPSKELEAIKCLLKKLSISDSFDRGFMVCQNLPGSSRLSAGLIHFTVALFHCRLKG